MTRSTANQARSSCSVISIKSGSNQQLINLIHQSAKGEVLVNFLMEIFYVCHKTGLEIVATVCDMVANNDKVLKHWVVSE